jgi:hypothetical protein
MHRFKKDPEWGECLARVRDGTLTVTDIEYINERVVKVDTVLPLTEIVTLLTQACLMIIAEEQVETMLF